MPSPTWTWTCISGFSGGQDDIPCGWRRCIRGFFDPYIYCTPCQPAAYDTSCVDSAGYYFIEPNTLWEICVYCQSGYTAPNCRNCTLYCDSLAGPCGPMSYPYYRCECAVCPAGTTYNPATQFCDTTCPPNECWCEDTDECVDCSDATKPPCFAVLNCEWDMEACDWACDTPSCPAGQHWEYATCSCVADSGGGGDNDEAADFAVDLVETQAGALVRTYRIGEGAGDPAGGRVFVGVSWDRGVTWTAVQVNGASSLAAEDAAPTICRTSHDDLLVWYHSDAKLHCWLSDDQGVTWTEKVARVTPFKYPRAVVLSGNRTVVVAYDTIFTRLLIYHSPDFFQTPVAASAEITGLDATLVSLVADRAENLHLVYRAGTGIVHRYSDDGGYTWSMAASLVASGQFPTVAAGYGRGLLIYGTGGADMNARLLNETLDTVGSNPGVFASGFGTMGTWVGVVEGKDGLFYVVGKESDQDLTTLFLREWGPLANAFIAPI